MAHLIYYIEEMHSSPSPLSLILLLSHRVTLSPYFLLFKTLQQKFLIAFNLPSSFFPLFLTFACSLFHSICLFLHLYFKSLSWPASGLISSAAMQLDIDYFPVLFNSLLTRPGVDFIPM